MTTILMVGLIKSPGTSSPAKEQPQQQSGSLSIAVYTPKDEMDFTNICNTEKIITIDKWYEEWVGRALIDRSTDSMLYAGSELSGAISKHIEHIEEYLKTLKALNEKTAHYSMRYLAFALPVVIQNANNRLSQPLKLDFHNAPNPEDAIFDAKIGHHLTQVILPYVGDYFYEEIELATIGKPDETRISPVMKPNIEKHFAEIKHLSVQICNVLLKTVEYFATLKPENYFLNTPNVNKKEFDNQNYLFYYYKSFEYVLNKFKPEQCGSGASASSVRGIFSEALLGSNIEKSLKSTFFTNELFSLIQTNLVELNEVLEFDKFILVGLMSYESLISVRKIANRKISFTVEFINDFPNLDSKLKNDDKATPDAKHEFLVYLILYQLYVLLRTPQFPILQGKLSNVDVYSKILDWILTSNYFDNSSVPLSSMTVSSMDTLDTKTPSAYKFGENFISKQSFTIHYPALVTLLMKKANIKFADKKALIEKKTKDILLLIDYKTQGFKPDSIEPEILKLVDANILANTLGNLSKDLVTMKFDDTIKKCKDLNKKEYISDNFTPTCTKDFGDAWIVLFNKYFGKLTDKDNASDYVNQLKSSVKSIANADHRSLMFYSITSYFRSLALKKFADLKIYEVKMCEAYASESLNLMASQIDPASTRGFTNFLLGVSNKNSFGKYFSFTNDQEADFHAFNIFFISIYSNVMRVKTLRSNPATNDQGITLQKETKELMNNFNNIYVNFQKSREKDMKDKPFRYIKMAIKSEFIVKFVDFFDIFYFNFDVSKQMSLPIYSNQFISVHAIFVNFYHFLFHVRETLTGPVDSPYDFLLSKLEECLDYSSRPSAQPVDQLKEGYCQFSNRKYAEMYYFYKFYLMLKGKKTDVSLKTHNEHSLNTHTRMFIIYAKNNKDFEGSIQKACAGEENSKIDFCAAYDIFDNFYETVMNSSRRGTTFEFVKQFFQSKLAKDGNNSQLRMDILFASESISLLVDGNGVNYSRFMSLFSLENSYNSVDKKFSKDFEEDKKILDLFKIQVGDVASKNLLVQYLIRTYKKTTFKIDEVAMSEAVKSIMEEKMDDKSNILENYFSYGGSFIFAYVKIFLMFSSSDSHYEKIADYLIKHSVFLELANLNKPNDDPVFSVMIDKLANLDKNFLQKSKDPKSNPALPHDIAAYRLSLQHDLEAKYHKMVGDTADKLGSMLQLGREQNVDDGDENGMFDDLMSEIDESEKENEKTEKLFEASEKSKSIKTVTITMTVLVTVIQDDDSLKIEEMQVIGPIKLSPSKDIALTGNSVNSKLMKSFDPNEMSLEEENSLNASQKTILKNYLSKIETKDGIQIESFSDDSSQELVMESCIDAAEGVRQAKGQLNLETETVKPKMIERIRRDLEEINQDKAFKYEADLDKGLNFSSIRMRKNRGLNRNSIIEIQEKI